MWDGPMDGPISGIFLSIAEALTQLPEPLSAMFFPPFLSAALIGTTGL